MIHYNLATGQYTMLPPLPDSLTPKRSSLHIPFSSISSTGVECVCYIEIDFIFLKLSYADVN